MKNCNGSELQTKLQISAQHFLEIRLVDRYPGGGYGDLRLVLPSSAKTDDDGRLPDDGERQNDDAGEGEDDAGRTDAENALLYGK